MVMITFGMMVNAQDYAMVDHSSTTYTSHSSNTSDSNENELSETNRASFIKNYSKKAKTLSMAYVDGKIVALKKGYTYKGKFHWLIMVIQKGRKVNMYAFNSSTDFSNITHKPFDKTKNFRTYILNNY